MKKQKFLLAILFLIFGLGVNGQSLISTDTIITDGNFENAKVIPLHSDSTTSTFVIFVKKTVPAHFHAHHTEQVFVLEGEGIMQMGDQNLEVKAGDFIIIPKNTIHAVEVTSEQPMKVISIQSPQFFGKDRIMVSPKKEKE